MENMETFNSHKRQHHQTRILNYWAKKHNGDIPQYILDALEPSCAWCVVEDCSEFPVCPKYLIQRAMI